MMSDIFYWFLNMSILGGIGCILVLFLRRLRKIPRTFIYSLWIIPLVRLVIPFGVTSPYSIMTLISNFTTRTVVVYEKSPLLPELALTNTLMAADRYFPIEYKTNLLESICSITSVIWIIVAIAAMLAATLLYIFTKNEIKNAIPYKDNIWLSDRITAPALYGILHPKIIIPKGMSDTNMNYVVLHEQTHARRRDNLWRYVAILLCCLHWFNPICWISLKYFFEDMELACDTRVLKKLDASSTKEYAQAILDAVTHQNLFVAAFGGAKVKIRIENILSYRKLTLISTIAFTVFIVFIILVLITNASI